MVQEDEGYRRTIGTGRKVAHKDRGIRTVGYKDKRYKRRSGTGDKRYKREVHKDKWDKRTSGTRGQGVHKDKCDTRMYE